MISYLHIPFILSYPASYTSTSPPYSKIQEAFLTIIKAGAYFSPLLSQTSRSSLLARWQRVEEIDLVPILLILHALNDSGW